jgi:hypothetical protein
VLRAIFRFGVLLLPLLSGAAVLAYSAAHTEETSQALSEFLHPGECPSPCWQGIRPGFTRSGPAIDILRAHPWVTNLHSIQGGRNESFVRWNWTGEQPPVVNPRSQGGMWFYNGQVYAILIPLTVQFSDVWAALGAPEAELFQTVRLDLPRAFYNAYYFGRTLEIRGTIDCPLNTRNLLEGHVEVFIAVPEQHVSAVSPSENALCRFANR